MMRILETMCDLLMFDVLTGPLLVKSVRVCVSVKVCVWACASLCV